MNSLRYFFIGSVLCLSCLAKAQLKFCSWNIQNFGKSKTDSNILFISKTLSGFDLVALIEVVAGPGGPQAVARLHDALNRTGSKWDYALSDPTISKQGSSERYAFLWKTSTVRKLKHAWLDTVYEKEIEREPFFCPFVYGHDTVLVSVFHAVPKSKQPETEIKYFKLILDANSHSTMLVCGDFNCAESNTVFNPIKSRHYVPVFSCQKTTLKSKCVNQECLASEYDNIFYPSQKLKLRRSGVISFHKEFADLKAARKISDHLPVYAEFE